MYDHKLIEAHVEKLWAAQKAKIEKSLKYDPKKPLFSFLEGPPTPNAPPGLHHLETRVFKDLVCRYKYMCGYTVPRKAGWDCHGLPIEVQVEKKLGLKTKKDVVKYGIKQFNEVCQKEVFSHIDEWQRFTKKSAFWIDTAHPYITMTNEYIESVWWSLKQLWKKGLLYQGHKVVPYCPRCETALSSHEVAQGYKQIETESITVKFRAKNRPEGTDVFFLGWTTTPWTLPSNVALAVNPEIKYAFVRAGHELFILARSRVEHYFGQNANIEKEVLGKELEGIEYVPVFDYFANKIKAWYVVSADFVTDSEGTGIVHIAPAFGEEDYEVAQKHSLPFLQPVSRDGKFTSEVSHFSGKFVIDADPEIIDYLNSRGLIFMVERYKHDYPFCWRCETPLLYYATNSWFIAVSKFQKELVKWNNKINWFPPHIKEGRFGNWIGQVRDWALSRTKFWGTPLPIWRCTVCGNELCIGSIAELKELATTKLNKLDLHKPYVDKIILKCQSCSGPMERVPEVIDTWYDSGSASFAQWHYPFENKDMFRRSFPYDFIAEAIDQTRGWFYTLHALAVLLFGKNAYKAVVCAGHIADDKGMKMSKSKGNVIDPWEIFEAYGADAARLLMCHSSPGSTKKVGPHSIEENVMPLLNSIWNCMQFTKAISSKTKGPKMPEDKWIISRANSLISSVQAGIEKHEYQNSIAAIQNFVIEDLSRWYIKIVRARRNATVRSSLEQCFGLLAKLLAPFAPYLADYIWTALLRHSTSVHFQSWPKPGKRDPKLEKQMQIIKSIVEASNAARAQKQIKLKYILPSLTVVGTPRVVAAVKKLKPILAAMANVKEVKIGKIKPSYRIKPNWPVAGKKFGQKIKQIAKELSAADANKIKRELTSKGYVVFAHERLTSEDLIFEEHYEGLAGQKFDGGQVFIETKISPQLKQEWLVRELIRAVQQKRKELKLKPSNKITLYIKPEPAFKKFANKIATTTSSKIVFKLGGKLHEFEFEGKRYKFGVRA